MTSKIELNDSQSLGGAERRSRDTVRPVKKVEKKMERLNTFLSRREHLISLVSNAEYESVSTVDEEIGGWRRERIGKKGKVSTMS